MKDGARFLARRPGFLFGWPLLFGPREHENVLPLSEQISAAVAKIRAQFAKPPRVGIILGTGLGGLAAQIDQQATIRYEDIPHFPKSTVASHAGQLVCGSLRGVALVAMEGRFHYYEGYSMQQVTFPVRVMKALGADILLVTNAAGGMNPEYNLGDVVIIDDHINLMPENPLRGVNDDSLGPRFPDMCDPYDRELIGIAQASAKELGIPCRQGVFVAVPGPNLETRAEYRMLRGMGADVVGMSTAPEVIVAVHAGLRTLAFSIVTDRCLPNSLEPVNIEKILEVAAIGGQHLNKLIPRVIEQL
jgi:purine-nucleoside phosphorylase